MRTIAALAALAGLALADGTSTLLTGPPMGVYKTANTQAPVTATTLTGVTLTTGAVHKRAVPTNSETGPPMGVYKTANWASALTAETLSATSVPSAAARIAKRDTCVAQPSGISYSTSPDDPNSFMQDTYYSNASTAAVTPSGYTLSFSNIVAANSADNYLGFTTLNTYDVASCASQCNAITGCASFNIYYERDPTLEPDATACPNPPSLTRIKCVWWGGLVNLNNAVNYGNQEASFYVVVAGSNGYNGNAAAASLSAAAAASSTSSAVTATQTATDGSVYTVYYGSDSTEGSFTNSQANASFTECMTACDNTTGCAAFTYVGAAYGNGAGTCWLKDALGTPTSASETYIAAVRVSSGGSVASASATTTSSSSTSSAAAVSTVSASSTSSWSLYRPVYVTTSSYSTTPVASTSSYSTTPAAATLAAAASSSASSSVAASSSSSTTSSVGYTAPVLSSSTSSSSAAVSSSSSTTSSVGYTAPVLSSSSVSSSAAASSSSLSTSSVGYTAPVLSSSSASSKVAASSSSTTTSAAGSLIPSIANNILKTSASSTFATSVVASSTFATSVIASSTSATSSAAVATSTNPATGKFIVAVGTSPSSAQQYLNVNWFAAGKVTFTSDKTQATQFSIDSNGFWIEYNALWLLSGYKASVTFKGGAWQKTGFNILSGAMDPATCQITGGMVQCVNSAGFVYAGTCNNDGYLYLGAPGQMSRGCSWAGLYPQML